MMVGVAAAAMVFSLVAYRERYLPSFDETGGGLDGLIVAVVDIGLCLGIPAALMASLYAWIIVWIVDRSNRVVDNDLGAGDPTSDEPNPLPS